MSCDKITFYWVYLDYCLPRFGFNSLCKLY